jgi:hypothetical protein
MKYIEELSPGECFLSDNKHYILTSDFKKNGSRLCYDLRSGHAHWLDAVTIVTLEPIYGIDKDNNFYPIKNENNYSTNTTSNYNIP